MRMNEMITKDENNVVMLEQILSWKQYHKECMKNSVEKIHVDVGASRSMVKMTKLLLGCVFFK